LAFIRSATSHSLRNSSDHTPASTLSLSWREIAGATVLFTVLAFAIFGWYAFHGGFIADDWVNADHYYFHTEPGFWGAVDNYQTPSRPVAAVYVSLTYAVLGNHFHLHLVLAVLLAGFLSIAFFAFLRTLGLGRLLALAAAALLLVFPSSDSTRFWTTGSQINLFIGLYLVAMVIAIAGRRRYGPAPTLPAVGTQALASALAVTAVAGYEIVAPAVLLSVGLYRWTCGRGGEVWHWLMDAIPTVLVLVFFTQKFSGGGAHGMQLLTNVHTVADGAVSVLGYTLIPDREASRWAVFGGVVAIIIVIALIKWAFRASRRHGEISRWLGPLLLAAVGIAIGYLMIVPAGERYPLYAPGVQNRTNCFAALGFSALVVFLAAALASIATASVPGLTQKARLELRRLLAGILVLGIFAVYTVRITEDESRWTKAAELQAQILAGSRTIVPSPPADATIFTSPYPGYSSPSVPIFGGGGNNDEVSAFKISYESDKMRAFPLLEGVGVICGPRQISTPDAGDSGTDYGKAILIDLRTATDYRPMNQSECLKVTAAMEPFGPVNLSDTW
jgi:hypothetical protein